MFPLSSRNRSQSGHLTPKRPLKVHLPSGVDQNSALKKSEDLHRQLDQYRKREEQYQQIIFAKDQEIAMMKQHIHQLEESTVINQKIDFKSYEQSALRQQITLLSEQIQQILQSYNQRIQEIEELKKSKGQTHTELERQVLQLLRENTLLVNSLNNSQADIKKLSISKIQPNNNNNDWKNKFIRLNKEFHLLQEKLVMALAELDNFKLVSRSHSIESLEAILRF